MSASLSAFLQAAALGGAKPTRLLAAMPDENKATPTDTSLSSNKPLSDEGIAFLNSHGPLPPDWRDNIRSSGPDNLLALRS